VSSLRASSTTLASCWAAMSAVVRPMPLLAPVITITWADTGLSCAFMCDFL
jgi:hypothetical protein